MADRADLEFTYSLTDRIFRLSLGELADFSGAKYDGDFSLSLEDAQRRKHEYVAERIGIRPGRRLLDLGCGWGPLLNFVRECGGEGVGVTLCSAQAESCRRHGLDVHLMDVREVGRDTFGRFDAVAGLGSFEHFCSPEDYRAGRQDDVYRDVFARAASVLSDGGRLYLQTIEQWRARFANRSLRKTLMKARLVPRYLTSSEFRLAFSSGVSANSVCFERELLDHFRLVFEKR